MCEHSTSGGSSFSGNTNTTGDYFTINAIQQHKLWYQTLHKDETAPQ